MDSPQIASRPKRSLIDKFATSNIKDKYYRNMMRNYSTLEKNQVLKNNRIRWDSFFLEDEKLASYFLAAQMTGNFFSIPVPTRYTEDNVKAIDLGELRLIFNTAYSTINYFKLRYSHRPDLIKAFVEGMVYLTPNNITSLLSDIFDFNRDMEEKKLPLPQMPHQLDMRKNIPMYASGFLKNWELLLKLNNELMALEKTAAINYPYFFYQVLHFYYYETPLITKKEVETAPTFTIF
jgi:hypothetical protein